MCTFIVNSREHQDQFAADQVAVRKEAERQAKRKLTENNRRRLLYKKPVFVYCTIVHVVQLLREELDRRIKEKKESKA